MGCAHAGSILGTGLFLSVGLKFMSIARIPFGFRLLWKGRIPGEDAGGISPFNALMAVPNLVALIVLGPIVFKITKEFFDSRGDQNRTRSSLKRDVRLYLFRPSGFQSQTACLVQAKGCSGISGGI